MPADPDLPPAALDYGRLAISTLARVTIVSAAALTVALAVLLTAGRRLPGLPYGDLVAALLAIGGSASLACLASAAAYAAQASRAYEGARLARPLRTTTNVLMAAAYVAFGVGGLAFSRFCLAAAHALAQSG